MDTFETLLRERTWLSGVIKSSLSSTRIMWDFFLCLVLSHLWHYNQSSKQQKMPSELWVFTVRLLKNGWNESTWWFKILASNFIYDIPFIICVIPCLFNYPCVTFILNQSMVDFYFIFLQKGLLYLCLPPLVFSCISIVPVALVSCYTFPKANLLVC